MKNKSRNTPDNKEYAAFIAVADKKARGLLNESIQLSMKTDPCWKEKKLIHSSILVTSFASSIIETAPALGQGIAVPRRMEGVLKWISFMVSKTFDQEVIETSVLAAVNMVKGWAVEHPEFRKWQEFGFDQEVIFQNMSIYLMTRIKDMEEIKKYSRKGHHNGRSSQD